MSFTKQSTNIVKGVVLLFLFAHHFFAFPEWLDSSYISIPVAGNTVAYYIGQIGAICIPVFAFLTGYGMFFSYQKGSSIKISAKKLINFLLNYWILLFLVFIPIQKLFGRTDFNEPRMWMEMTGLYTSIVNFSWYVRFYILAMITLPFMRKMVAYKMPATSAIGIFSLLLVCIAIGIVQTQMTISKGYDIVSEYFRYMTCTLLGVYFAQFEIFSVIHGILKKYKMDKIWVYLPLFIGLLVLNYFTKDRKFLCLIECVYIPFVVFFIDRIEDKIKILNKPLSFVGKYSMNLWLMQSIFFVPIQLQWIAYLPKFSILIEIWGVLILLPFSMALTFISRKIIDFMIYVYKLPLRLKSKEIEEDYDF